MTPLGVVGLAAAAVLCAAASTGCFSDCESPGQGDCAEAIVWDGETRFAVSVAEMRRDWPAPGAEHRVEIVSCGGEDEQTQQGLVQERREVRRE